MPRFFLRGPGAAPGLTGDSCLIRTSQIEKDHRITDEGLHDFNTLLEIDFILMLYCQLTDQVFLRLAGSFHFSLESPNPF